MIYLVDANVLSEPTKPSPSPRVVEWLAANEASFVVDAVVLGELCLGIAGLAPGHKRKRLEQWFSAVVQRIDCVPWDASVAMRWAHLVADLRRKGQSMPLLDSMIAATALKHGLTVATRNVRDFAKTGVAITNPFA